MRKLNRFERGEFKRWVRRIVDEVDDDEMPEIMVQEIFDRGYASGVSDGHRRATRDLIKGLGRIKKQFSEQLNELKKDILP